ncbi:hypothetical protein ES711_12960 [Gelidibacter salicanalis]|uniref:PorT family protein n=1 Tax=Gelidibacter salicanalis TaxID=291193 RepID=A0A5C7AJQ8_9FLAO|nr:hypothetical protein [Gelidibacter salicanalis]TXE06855.1 hypothetical protein ES711_12960 [Gelidibacter salicanalis]
MNTIVKCIVLASLCLIMGNTQAQDTLQKNKAELRIERLIQFKDSITQNEKASLKTEVETINKRLERGEITKLQADALKQEMAKKRALNIENRLAIADSQIALIKRNPEYYAAKQTSDTNFVFSIGSKKIMSFARDSTPKYDIRSSNMLLFAIGFNNTIMDGQSLEDSPYEIGGSGFVELGWIWSTRVLKNSNFVRVNYGLAFQWNKLSIKDNQYFVENGKETVLETYPLNLKKSKFRTTSLVVPVHFEFGPSKLKDYGDRIRYFNDNQFKIGLGGFAGLNLNTMQKVKFKVDGDNQKEKVKSDFNTNSLMYGLSGYVGLGDFSIYAKYNLNTLFKNQEVDQRNVSLGLRWALD